MEKLSTRSNDGQEKKLRLSTESSTGQDKGDRSPTASSEETFSLESPDNDLFKDLCPEAFHVKVQRLWVQLEKMSRTRKASACRNLLDLAMRNVSRV